MPKEFDPSVLDEILERYAAGETIQDICQADHMPAGVTVSNWRRTKPEFAAAMDAIDEANCARQEGVHKSTGWCQNKLPGPKDERTPEWPEPQGPDCSSLITDLHDRRLQSDQDEFKATSLQWDAPRAGQKLNFN